jgi:DNA topoisomerase-6 subunit B
VVVEDNGPGIVKQQIPKIFGKLLYGSKFHRLKQSRGQQGIGISAAGMYGQLTTGKAVVITSRTKPHRPANQFEIVLNTRKNTPDIVAEREIEWQVEHGTRVEIELQGTYKGGRTSVDAYLEQVAIANPHAEIYYAPPKGKSPVHLPRATEELPPEGGEIKPHPYGVELGMLMKLLKDSKNRTLSATLQNDFSRVTSRVAQQICEAANLRPKASPRTLPLADVERLYKAIPKVRIMAPPTSCVVPIDEELIRRGLEREIKADLYVSATRPPSVYRGNPFRVEVGLAYGGELRREDPAEEEALDLKNGDRSQGPITLIRFANRVPLQYQQSACAIFKSVVETNWKPYGLSQPRGSLPHGPMVLLVHLASVWVPFTSESKEAIAHYPEIIKEIKLALRECGRKLSTYLRRKEKARLEAKRRSIFEVYIGELVEALHKLTAVERKRLHKQLAAMSMRHTGGIEAAEMAGIDTNDEIESASETETDEATDTKDRTEVPASSVKKAKARSKRGASKKQTKKAPASKKRARTKGKKSTRRK